MNILPLLISLCVGLTLTILYALFMFILQKDRHKNELNKLLDEFNKAKTEASKSPEKDMALLADLMSNKGRAIIEIKRISSSEVFLRSPKDLDK